MFRHADVVCLCIVCIHEAVLNAEFCMTCSLLRWSRMHEATIWKRHTPKSVTCVPYR